MKTFLSIVLILSNGALALAAADAISWRETQDSELQSFIARERAATYDYQRTELNARIVDRLVDLKNTAALLQFFKDQGAVIPLDVPGLHARISAADFLMEDESARDLAKQLLEQVVGATDEVILSASITSDRIKTFNEPSAQERAVLFPAERKAKMVEDATNHYRSYVLRQLPQIRKTASSRLAKIIRQTQGISGLAEATKKYKSIEVVGPYFQEYLAKVVASDK